MKWLIASDVHGDAECARMLVDAFEKERASRILLLGDLLYHGPRNALPAGYDPKECAEVLNTRRDSIISVRGNCDAEVDQLLLGFPMMAEYALIPFGDRTFFATHGHVFCPDSPPPMKRGDVLLCGHTHVPACEVFGDLLLSVNPGSASIPKNGSPRSYMTFEDGLFCWVELESNEVFRTYDITRSVQ